MPPRWRSSALLVRNNPSTKKMEFKPMRFFGRACVSLVFLFAAFALPASAQQISASNNPCNLPNSSTPCSTTITWDAGGWPNAAIWVSSAYGAGWFAAGSSGSADAPWIQTGWYTFSLRREMSLDSPELARVDVYGQLTFAQISSSPGSCEIPWGGSTCSVQISWNSGGWSDAAVWVSSAYGSGWFGGGGTGLQDAPWIQEGTYTFTLYQSGSLSSPVLASTTVTGTRAPQPLESFPTLAINRSLAGFSVSGLPSRPFTGTKDYIYAIRQDLSLSSPGQTGQSWWFTVSTDGVPGQNIFNDAIGDHLAVGLNHRFFSSPPGNTFLGVAIGDFGKGPGKVCLEFKKPGLSDYFGIGDGANCYSPALGTTTLHMHLEVWSVGCARLSIYNAYYQHVHSNPGNGQLDCNYNFWTDYGGMAVGAITSAQSANLPHSYNVTFTPGSHSFLP
ncbi:MAG: hypothetical protein SF172_08730 [Burkholderiales bacterium]|nr:hypothetical protein [Burkholderiales bacterium]